MESLSRLSTKYPSYRFARIIQSDNSDARMECLFYKDRVDRILKFTGKLPEHLLSLVEKPNEERNRIFIDSISAPYVTNDIVVASEILLLNLLDPELNQNDDINLHDGDEQQDIPLRPRQSKVRVQRGKYIDSGSQNRKFGGKTFNHFYIDIEDSELENAVQRIWGNDLKRALEQADAKVGDMIEITSKGWVPVELPNTDNAGAEVVERQAFVIATTDKLGVKNE